MASSMVFSIIKALSCHLNPTHSHPAVPTMENVTSNILGISSTDLHSTATHTNATDIHLTYQVLSCMGVTLRTELRLSSSASILSSISSTLFGVTLINPVDVVVDSHERSTLGHVLQSSGTYISSGR